MFLDMDKIRLGMLRKEYNHLLKEQAKFGEIK